MQSQVFPVIHQTAELKMERVVDLGPFKHKVDDALPLRKAAFACMDTILDTLLAQVDIPAFIPFLCLGLKDQDDVQMLCHQILAKLCTEDPGSVLSALDAVLEPLDKTVNKKVKDSQVGTQVERANDLIRSGVRAVDAVSRVPDIDKNRKFQEFWLRIQKKEKIATMLDVIRKEKAVSES